MILITLGTQDKSFERLLKAVDKEIENGKIKEKVIAQIGTTKYESKNMELFDLIPREKFDDLIEECSLLITHGGVGSILTGVTKGKKVIAAARLSKYGELVYVHQTQIVEMFAKEKYILELKDFSKLGKLIEKSKSFKPKKFVSNTQNLIEHLEDYIDNL